MDRVMRFVRIGFGAAFALRRGRLRRKIAPDEPPPFEYKDYLLMF
jgi:hypothetical protein